MTMTTVRQFVVVTFGIMLAGWGSLVVLGHQGITQDEHAWLFLLFMIGGLSPTIASYLVLKRGGIVADLRGWARIVFHARSSPWHYVTTAVFVILFFATQIAVSGVAEAQPFYMFFAFLPVMLVGGGMEEAGWRFILQPELDRKLGFVPSVIVTGVVWFAWHIPLFYIPGTGQSESDLWMFAINVMGMSFFYGAILRIAGRAAVFLSIVAHTMTNAAWNTLPFTETWQGTMATFAVMVVAATVVVLASKARGHSFEPGAAPRVVEHSKAA